MAGKSKVTIKYAVRCDTHGMESKELGWKVVYVGKPSNKREQLYTGCPMCRLAAVRAARTQADVTA